MRFSGLSASSVRLASVSLSLLLCRGAAAQVVEPNGISVPATVPGSTEITLQAYFNSVGETIDAVTDAAVSPAVFLPLCDFQATLVLSQSQAQAGLDWYNVPTSPTATPTLYPIGAPPLAIGSTVSSSDIRSNLNYTGGLIGFALMKDLGNGYVPVYYSEYMRNVDCTGCIMPGYWKMALSYQSTVTANGYYMAWEDWEGANATSWPDDGDCNGQVDEGTGLCPGTEVCIQGTSTGACGTEEFACQPGWQCQDGLCVDPKCVGVNCEIGQICHCLLYTSPSPRDRQKSRMP